MYETILTLADYDVIHIKWSHDVKKCYMYYFLNFKLHQVKIN